MAPPKTRYRQVVLQADTPTGNGRIYPKHVLEKAVQEFNSHGLRRFGPVGPDGVVRLKDVRFQVADLRMEGEKVVAEIDIFERGYLVAETLRRKVARLSPMGFGSLSKEDVVDDDYILTGFNVAPVGDCTTGEDGEFPEFVHWSDWSSQPTVRIACTKECGLPWKVRKDLPDQVHEIPVKGEPSILYSFEYHLVTCPYCLELESFQRARDERIDILTELGWTFPPDHPEGVPPK